jgi:hypothetical protein
MTSFIYIKEHRKRHKSKNQKNPTEQQKMKKEIFFINETSKVVLLKD